MTQSPIPSPSRYDSWAEPGNQERRCPTCGRHAQVRRSVRVPASYAEAIARQMGRIPPLRDHFFCDHVDARPHPERCI